MCENNPVFGLLAQLVEQRTLNPLVACSIRAESTKNLFLYKSLIFLQEDSHESHQKS